MRSPFKFLLLAGFLYLALCGFRFQSAVFSEQRVPDRFSGLNGLFLKFFSTEKMPDFSARSRPPESVSRLIFTADLFSRSA